MKKLLILLGVIVVFVVAIFVYRGNGVAVDTSSSRSTPLVSVSNSPSPSSTPSVSPSTTATAKPTATPAATIKTFTVTGKSFSFTPSVMSVNKGDTVKIVFNNMEGNHDWVIDEFNARTKVIAGGQTDTIQFVANKTGTFEYYCSVGEHRQLGMKGTLTVK